MIENLSSGFVLSVKGSGTVEKMLDCVVNYVGKRRTEMSKQALGIEVKTEERVRRVVMIIIDDEELDVTLAAIAVIKAFIAVDEDDCDCFVAETPTELEVMQFLNENGFAHKTKHESGETTFTPTFAFGRYCDEILSKMRSLLGVSESE